MTNGVLNITSLNLADIGMYQCVAENRHGRVFTNAELRVVGRSFFEKSSKLCRRHAAAAASVHLSPCGLEVAISPSSPPTITLAEHSLLICVQFSFI